MIDRKVLGLYASFPTWLLLIHKRRAGWLKRGINLINPRWINNTDAGSRTSAPPSCSFIPHLSAQPDKNSSRLIHGDLTENLALYLQVWKPPIIVHTMS